MKILISGSLAYDRIMDFPGKFSDHILPEKIHVLNVCFLVNGVVEKFGGTAGNIAYNLALLEERPLILSTAGTDFDKYEAWLKKLGLPLEGIRHIEGELTAGAYITTDMADNQITGFNPGAMRHASSIPIKAGSDGALAIISPGNLDDMICYSRTYKEKNIPFIFDPGQQIPIMGPEVLLEMVTGSRMLIANDYELQMIVHATGVDKSGLMQKTGAVITTLGEKGSLILTRKGELEIGVAKARKVVDPTGAGDAYRAGLIKGLTSNKNLVEAAKVGATCASFSVECYGTQEHTFTGEEFNKRLKENFG